MYDLLADVKLSIELEKKGYKFYTETAAKTKNPLAASTLSSLAARERIHIERIMEFYQNLTGEKILKSDWLKTVEFPPTRADLLKPILEKLEKNLQQKFETQKDIVDAYHIAEGLEVDSYTLYEKIAKETSDATAKSFYSALALEERGHYAILDETLQYLDNPGEWYRLKERWIVEG